MRWRACILTLLVVVVALVLFFVESYGQYVNRRPNPLPAFGIEPLVHASVGANTSLLRIPITIGDNVTSVVVVAAMITEWDQAGGQTDTVALEGTALKAPTLPGLGNMSGTNRNYCAWHFSGPSIPKGNQVVRIKYSRSNNLAMYVAEVILCRGAVSPYIQCVQSIAATASWAGWTSVDFGGYANNIEVMYSFPNSTCVPGVHSSSTVMDDYDYGGGWHFKTHYGVKHSPYYYELTQTGTGIDALGFQFVHP
jgi:hypothetical protein